MLTYADTLRGQVHSDMEAACNTWLNSALFAPGLRPAHASVLPYVEHFLRHSSACPDTHGTDDADEQTQAWQAALQQRLQPLLAVRVSQHLDALERVVVAVILYHCGELASVFSPAVAGVAGGAAAAGADTGGSSNTASLAARTVRRHAMELRDHANLALKESEEPQDWMVYCQVLTLLALLVQKYKYTHLRSFVAWRGVRCECPFVLSLLALLVQKYKY